MWFHAAASVMGRDLARWGACALLVTERPVGGLGQGCS